MKQRQNKRWLLLGLITIAIGCSVSRKAHVSENNPEIKEEVNITSDYYFEGEYTIWYFTKGTLIQSLVPYNEWISIDTNGQAQQSFRLPPTSTGGDSKIEYYNYYVISDTLFLTGDKYSDRKYMISSNRDTLTEINSISKTIYVGIKK